jgi:alpha-amylase
MSTKFFSDGAVHAYFNPYENPYQAFMNYMNVLSDFEIRLNIVSPVNDHDAEISRLSESIQTKDHLISELQEKLTKYERKGRVTRAKAVKAKKVTSATAAVKKAVTVKVPAKKAAPVKAAPVKAAPKKVAPKRAAPKKATAKKTSTKSVTAKKATK